MNKHFVAHFDMLGMSSLMRRDPELAWQKLSALSTAKERLLLDTEYVNEFETLPVGI